MPNVNPSELSRAGNLTQQTNVLISQPGGPLQRTPLEQLIAYFPAAQQAGLRAATTSLTPDENFTYIASAGTYSNFPDQNGIALTVPAGNVGFLYNISPGAWAVSLTELTVDFTNYLKKEETVSSWLKNPVSSFQYNQNELEAISYIRKLDVIGVSEADKNDNLALSILYGNDAGNYNGIFQGIFELKNATKNKNITFHTGKWTADEITKIWRFKGPVTYGDYQVYVDVELLLDKMPTSFQYDTFNNQPPLKIAVKVNNPQDELTLTNRELLTLQNAFNASQTIKPVWILNKDASYDAGRQKIFKAIKVLEFTPPAGEEANDWRLDVVVTKQNAGQTGGLDGTIFFRNYTTGDVWGFAVVPSSYFNTPIRGYKDYVSTKTTTVNGVSKTASLVLLIDYNELGVPFNFFELGGSNLNIIPAVFTLTNNLLLKNQPSTTPILYDTPSNKWKGKTILLLGTSIPAGGGHLEVAAQQLGATLINQALGSSPARIGYRLPDGTKTDQNMFWAHPTKALAHTTAEKQDIVDNWSTRSVTYYGVAGNGKPTTLSDSDKADILNASWEVRMKPYVAQADLILFNHDFNDNIANKPNGAPANAATETLEQFLYIDPADENNRYTPIGAITYLIREARKIKPTIQFAFIGCLENQDVNHFTDRLSLLDEKLAAFHERPLLRYWQLTGYSQRRIPNTASLRGQAPYSNYPETDANGNPVTGDLSAFKYRIADGLHPATAVSPDEPIFLGSIAAEWLSRIK